jgi:hypothetical protein
MDVGCEGIVICGRGLLHGHHEFQFAMEHSLEQQQRYSSLITKVPFISRLWDKVM